MDLSVLPTFDRADLDLQVVIRSDACVPHPGAALSPDARWEAARVACQLFEDAAQSAAEELGPFLNASCAAELMQVLIRERIAFALCRTLQRLAAALLVRFDEQRMVDNERYMVIVTDILTGEREEFGWTFGGGKAARLWEVERLPALAGKGVSA